MSMLEVRQNGSGHCIPVSVSVLLLMIDEDFCTACPVSMEASMFVFPVDVSGRFMVCLECGTREGNMSSERAGGIREQCRVVVPLLRQVPNTGIGT